MLPFLTNFAAACSTATGFSHFFSLPSWYEYLDCIPDASGSGKVFPQIQGLSDIWLIVAAIIDILLRLAALVAIGYVVYGGVQYITSQGDMGAPGRPGKTVIARQTIINALIGLVIAISAATLVGFIAGSFN